MSDNEDNNSNKNQPGHIDQSQAIFDKPNDDQLNTLEGQVLNQGVNSDQTMPVSLEAIDRMAEKTNLPARMKSSKKLPLEVLFDVPICLVFEVGRTDVSIKQLMEMRKDSFVELNQVSVDSIDVRVDGKLIAHAETISLQQRYGIRFGELELYSALENEAIDVTSH